MEAALGLGLEVGFWACDFFFFLVEGCRVVLEFALGFLVWAYQWVCLFVFGACGAIMSETLNSTRLDSTLAAAVFL